MNMFFTTTHRSGFSSSIRNLLSKVILMTFSFMCIPTSSAEDFYCSTGSQVRNISNENEGLIITLQKGKNYYSNKMSCEWYIDGGPGKRIQATVEASNLQYSPKFALCDGYDSVTITEGETSLASWCGYEYPDTINTRGQYMTIKFTSDENNPSTYQFTGARIRFQIFNASSCPPEWKEYQQFCYELKFEKENWMDAQETCNLEQANVASITSEDELDFIKNNFVSRNKFWIGLNDIETAGRFQWIDKTKAKGFPGFSIPTHKTYHHCAALDVKESEISLEECERSHLKYLCKTGKGEPSSLYPIPQGRTNKGEEGESNDGRVLLLAVLVPAAIILVVLIVGAFIYYQKNKSGHAREPEMSGNLEFSAIQRVDNLGESSITLTASAPPYSESDSSQHDAPPHYDEVVKNSVI